MSHTGKQIMVVDDDPAILETLSLILNMEGYEVALSIDGRQLLERLKEELPDLIVLDYRLPGQNGGQLARLLKTNHTTRQIPIIIISADHNIQHEAHRAGAEFFLPKPFDIDELLSCIESFIPAIPD